MAKAKIPFVDFYAAHGIIPTRQDISDLHRHRERRQSLYTHLGLPPVAFKGASIVEFGPGSGHNAVATGLLEPRSYLLVDGNPPSLASTKALLEKHCPNLNFSLRKSPITEFKSREKFDIVLCEAVIPTQRNPKSFLLHVASFVRPGGVLVMTCMDAISLLSEMLRRWLAWQLCSDISNFEQKVSRVAQFFKPDIALLPGMSRKPEDWVIDQLIHPWSGPLFSIPQALETLHGHHRLLGTSPRFITDWRWYKSITGDACTDLNFAIESYFELGLNLMDFRVKLPQSGAKDVRRAARIAQRIYDHIFAGERGRRPLSSRQLLQLLKPLETILMKASPVTASSLNSFCQYLDSGCTKPKLLDEFRPWWGRGQQYLSFLKHH